MATVTVFSAERMKEIEDGTIVSAVLIDGELNFVKFDGTLVPTGMSGVAGSIGPAGPSSYDLAVENGFIGTEEEYLEAIETAAGITALNGLPVLGHYTPTETEFVVEDGVTKLRLKDTIARQATVDAAFFSVAINLTFKQDVPINKSRPEDGVASASDAAWTTDGYLTSGAPLAANTVYDVKAAITHDGPTEGIDFSWVLPGDATFVWAGGTAALGPSDFYRGVGGADKYTVLQGRLTIKTAGVVSLRYKRATGGATNAYPQLGSALTFTKVGVYTPPPVPARVRRTSFTNGTTASSVQADFGVGNNPIAGNTLIAIIRGFGLPNTAALPAAPAGWTQIYAGNQGTAVVFGVYAKISDGTERLSPVFTFQGTNPGTSDIEYEGWSGLAPIATLLHSTVTASATAGLGPLDPANIVGDQNSMVYLALFVTHANPGTVTGGGIQGGVTGTWQTTNSRMWGGHKIVTDGSGLDTSFGPWTNSINSKMTVLALRGTLV